MIKKIRQWLDNLSMYVVVDGEDSSVTLSQRLVKDMGVMNMEIQPKVIVFRLPECHSYGFMLNPDIEQETQLCDIQYNDKYKTIGFESLCPTVSRILFDYNIPVSKCKLSVKKHRIVGGKIYYIICKPNGKFTR